MRRFHDTDGQTDPGRRAAIVPGGPRRAVFEWPTVLLISAVYLGFLAVTLWSETLTIWIALPLLAVMLAQHSSLQHEVLHGHPFGRRALSDLTVFIAIGPLIPYERFKQTHLRHHVDSKLTDPYEDPETNFLDPAVWARTGKLGRILLGMNNTLLGRMILGPAISLAVFYRDDLGRLAEGDRAVWRAWALHGVGVMPVALWLVSVATMPVWAYLIAAYCGASLLKIRSFLEHRAHRHSAGRSVIIEDRGPLALLFLNNNLHAVHHDHPDLAWYRLPAFYRDRKAEFQRRNFGYCYRSYREIFAQYLVAAKDPVVHPISTDTGNPALAAITQLPDPVVGPKPAKTLTESTGQMKTACHDTRVRFTDGHPAHVRLGGRKASHGQPLVGTAQRTLPRRLERAGGT